MPDLDFKVMSVAPAARGIVPMLHFQMQITNEPAAETIQSVILQAQIQIVTPQRSYNDVEKEKLVELFGAPERWGETLRTKLWAHAAANVSRFTGRTEVILPVPCTYDLNVTATKYFYALEAGEVPLLFLFSGTIFYTAPDGRLQIQRISWEKEAAFRMPVRVWQELMEYHFPGSAWISLSRELFERLYAFKRQAGLPTWEQVMERLLAEQEAAVR